MIRFRLTPNIRSPHDPTRVPRWSLGRGSGIRTLLAVAIFSFIVTAAVTLTVGAQEDAPSGLSESVSQPIAFSHRQHVTGAGLDCQFCHTYARRGPVAGIPSVARCTGCHNVVLPERPEVAKVLTYAEREESIPWVRVHRLPDYVRFTHKKHVRAGVGCDTCHGDVGQMDIVEQVSPLTMGWCLSCHEQRRASVDCLTCHY